jgi:hypothetical protein
MDDKALAAQQPKDIDEALEYMRSTLQQFHAAGDRRAFFLRVYYMMTLEVHAAIHGTGAYVGRPVFMDPTWIEQLSGKFASLYFKSLTITGDGSAAGQRAWGAAHGAARSPRSTVLLNALLGIVAHIKKDLAQAIAENLLEFGDLDNPTTMIRRRFDHDQVNNLLIRVMGSIQDTLARDYEPVLGVGDRVLGGLDERLSSMGLRHYREQVWSDALTYAAMLSQTDPEHVELGTELVRAKLDWESHKLAEEVTDWRAMWFVERTLGRGWPWRRGRDWTRIEL